MNKVIIPEITILAKKQLFQLPPNPSTCPTQPQSIFSPSKISHSPEGQILAQYKEEFPNHEGYWIASHSSCGSKSWEQFKAQILSLPEIYAYMAC